ncbi:primase-helicase family protein [Aquimarina algiphila]|uniref:primase-helicase family protein n=1 Tax=Aquimarina algiphila TaxID=2047982 RepID=UPI00248F7F79|nr:primase-helicase family protein [Aquimarina algiphila]
MSEFKFDKEHLLEHTNGGLDVILRLYPQAEKNGRFVHFKLRKEETTASALIKEMPDGNHIVTDFGGDGKGKNCFDLVMKEEGLTFAESCKWIASEFQIDGLTVQFNTPELEFKAATKNQKDGQYIFSYHSKISDKHLKVLGALVNNEICEKFKLRSCEQFIQIKEYKDKDGNITDRKQIITRSTEKYPIFVFDFGIWQKIYQPLNSDKQYRFRYAGEKPKDYIFGLDVLKNDHVNFINKYDGDEENPKLENVIIASGDRDALNIASLEYSVVWQNSESAVLEYSDYQFLTKRVKNVLYLGDIDETGITQTIKLALSYIHIKIIWLPEWIKKETYRGKPRKDFKDYVDLVYKGTNPKDKLERNFKALVSNALPARFWDTVIDDKGRIKKYTFNNEACYQFLTYNGFYRYEEEAAKEDFGFIRVKDGIVHRVKYHHLSAYPTEYLKHKQQPIPLINSIHRTAQLSEKSLAKLPLKNIDFKDCGYDHQLLFFQNKIWKITKETISEYNYGKLDAHVWEDKIIKHKVKVNKEKAFKITTTEQGTFDIEITRTDNHFLNYLINTSRVHWRVCGEKPFKSRIKAITETDTVKRKELITKIQEERKTYQIANRFNIQEKRLSTEQIKEQKDHLINKIFALGYLLHKQKVDDKAWVVFAMDNRISEIADSNGGSGKSLMFEKAVRQILLSNKYIAGRDREAVKDKHMYEGVSKDTDYVLFDDLDSHFPIGRVFSEVTGEFNVNAKYKAAYTIPFTESPKIAMTSNFGLFKPDGSSERRILYAVFSDYYHYKSDLDEKEHKVTTDIGKLMFSQFDDTEWSDFFNVCAEAIQFHLSTNEKINPPLGNVAKRNSLQTMGDGFKEWADFYFENRKDQQVVKNIAYSDFENRSKLKGWTSQRFKKAIKEWCKFYHYKFNPEEVLNSQGHNKHNHNGAATEFVYIQSNPFNNINTNDQNDQLDSDFDPTDDVQF